MVAAGRGNALVSRLIHRAHAESGWFLYATVCALVEADRARPGTAEHLAAPPGIAIVDTAGRNSRCGSWTSASDSGDRAPGRSGSSPGSGRKRREPGLPAGLLCVQA
ncbi:hypothetical protein [Streptomyces geranii]|uniref:hypothetical protein n=1 Tax=Streptomyces geranii TaxID=2058923 RepID=UPI0038CDBA18